MSSFFITFSGAVGASCICASPLFALAAFDLDEARPLRSILNWCSVALALVAAATVFF